MESVDIHLLQLRYAHTRVMKTSVFRRLRNSIETYGQIVPALVVEDDEKKLVLIDGYMRVRALLACGRDQVFIDLNDDNEQNAIFSLLNKSSERQWEAMEQAVLIQEMQKTGMSLRKIAETLKVSRNTVRDVIRDGGKEKSEKESQYEQHVPLIQDLSTLPKPILFRAELLETGGI